MAVQLVFSALVLAACTALLALGFVLVLNATGAVNFAHGDLVMAGGFVAVTLAGRLHWPGLAVLPLVLVAMAGLGLAVALLGYLPLRRRPPEAVFIATIAIGAMLQNGATLLFGGEPRAAPALIGAGAVRQGIAAIAVAAVLVAALHLLLTRTMLGWRLRATAQDREAAAALGIPVNAMIAGSFALGAALAGAAGMLLANTYLVTPGSGADDMLTAYLAVVVGGWGSIPGAVAGAALIAGFAVLWPSLPLLVPALHGPAFTETGGTVVLDILVLLILAFRPRGLFGEAFRQRV
jgi:branched-chain amino acid transport system permease protein